MKFDVWKDSNGELRIGTDIKTAELWGMEKFGTLELPIEKPKVEVEKTVFIKNFYASLDEQTKCPALSIPKDAYDVKVHYKVKE
jgi:hypothetical protein